MTRKRDRIFALFGAVLFFVSASALTVAVIWQMTQDNKNKDANTQTATTQQENKENKNMLEGTQLQNFTPVADVTELQVIDTQPGTGSEVKEGDTVTVDYTGAVAATGKIFQSSLDSGQPVSFPLSNVIQGWQEGIPGMKTGGVRRIIIPAEKAYGANPPSGSGIPANAALVFDVTLHSIGE